MQFKKRSFKLPSYSEKKYHNKLPIMCIACMNKNSLNLQQYAINDKSSMPILKIESDSREKRELEIDINFYWEMHIKCALCKSDYPHAISHVISACDMLRFLALIAGCKFKFHPLMQKFQKYFKILNFNVLKNLNLQILKSIFLQTSLLTSFNRKFLRDFYSI